MASRQNEYWTIAATGTLGAIALIFIGGWSLSGALVFSLGVHAFSWGITGLFIKPSSSLRRLDESKFSSVSPLSEKEARRLMPRPRNWHQTAGYHQYPAPTPETSPNVEMDYIPPPSTSLYPPIDFEPIETREASTPSLYPVLTREFPQSNLYVRRTEMIEQDRLFSPTSDPKLVSSQIEPNLSAPPAPAPSASAKLVSTEYLLSPSQTPQAVQIQNPFMTESPPCYIPSAHAKPTSVSTPGQMTNPLKMTGWWGSATADSSSTVSSQPGTLVSSTVISANQNIAPPASQSGKLISSTIRSVGDAPPASQSSRLISSTVRPVGDAPPASQSSKLISSTVIPVDAAPSPAGQSEGSRLVSSRIVLK